MTELPSYAYLSGCLALARQSVKPGTVNMTLAERFIGHADMAMMNGNIRTALEMILMSLTYSVGLRHPYYEDTLAVYRRIVWADQLAVVV